MSAGADAPLDACLADAAAARPGRPAVVDPSGRCLTYRELDRAADRVAAFLRGRGIGPGARVALMTGRRCATSALLFGILRAGAAYVPVDPAGAGARIRRILADCRPALLFHDPDAADRLRPHLPDGAGGADGSGVSAELGGPGGAVAWTRAPAGAPEDAPEQGGSPLACLLYTSGSTGVPKGVRLTRANVRAFTEWAAHRFALGPDDRVAGFAPLHFDLSLFDVFATVRAGAVRYLVPDAVTADPRAAPGFLDRHGITVWYATPSVLRPAADAAGPVPSALRLVLFAGEVFPVPALRRLTRRWPGADYYNLYGPTETNVCAFAPVPLPVPDERTEPYPIGQPCPHCRVMLVDEEGRPVPEGSPGLLCVSGPSVFPGYWGRPDDPGFVHGGRRWYNTGDVARPTPEGLVFCGRRDRMVKRAGHRIELDEIEAVLARCPAVRDVAVVADTGAASATITAFVVASGGRLDQIALRRFCRHQLGPHLVPDRFRGLERLPLTSTGKTDYQGLGTRGRP